jgi:serine/threonine-protein kinase
MVGGAVTPGTIGRYAIVDEIAAGGFGTVYRATDPMLGRDLAIKVLHPHLARDPQMRARFLAEGRALAAIRHPHLVQVYDAGEADGRAYLVMEYVPGRSLAVAAHGRSLPAPEIIRITAQIAGALDAVHAANLVHRDVKPANILLADDGRAVLLDLGIARRLEEPGLTSNSVLLGTPGYLAPEQLQGGAPVGPPTDVYQLGATVYALLTGRAPFEGDISTVIYAVAHEPPPDLGEARPDLPGPIVAAVTRALAKRPENRPATAGAFAAELAGGPLSASSTRPATRPPTTPDKEAAAPPPTGAAPAADDAATRRRRRLWLLAAGGVALLLLLLGLAAVALRRETSTTDDAPTVPLRAAISDTAVAPPAPSAVATPAASPTPVPSPAITPSPAAVQATTPPSATASAASTPAPVTATPPPSPAEPNPATSLVGQRTTACTYGVDFEIAVTRVEWTKTVIGATAPGNGMWIVAIIDVTNLGTKAEALTTRPLQLRDERGRQYNVREYPPDPVELFRAYMVHAAFQAFQPGITEQSVVTFQVPDTIGPLTLAGKRDFC